MAICSIPFKSFKSRKIVSNLERQYCTEQHHLKRKTFSTLTVINATFIMYDECGAGTVTRLARGVKREHVFFPT